MPDTSAPPAYAWDWFGRQRLVWAEARRRLAPPPAAPPAPPGAPPGADGRSRAADVPDWSELLDRGPVRPTSTGTAGGDVATAAARDWAALATRAEVVAALRAEYAHDHAVQTAVDGAVADVAFLGRRGGDLAVLGLRTPPRGLRWWWTHLGGVDADPVPAEPRAAGVQLTLADVMTGYGDPAPVG